MNKQIVNQALTELEKEQQEQKINEVKRIVSSYLEKIAEQKVIVDSEQNKLKLLKKDLDDLKAGRLDKIEDRQKFDPVAKNVSVIIIRRTETYLPMQPWRSEYDWYYTDAVGSTTSLEVRGQVTGTFCQNFVSGSYRIGNKIINF